MWEMIERMASDRLWIYTGAAFLVWFQGTRAGLWCYAQFVLIIDFFVQRYGWTWLEPPKDAWRKKYPHVTKKIDQLETRIKKLENKG